MRLTPDFLVHFLVILIFKGIIMSKNKEIKKMERVLDFCKKVATVEHEDSEKCWCDPQIEKFENGNKVIIHNDFN